MRKEKAIALVTIAITIFATLPMFVAATNDIFVTYHFDESEILNWLDIGKPMKNLRVQAMQGEPLLPYKIAKILLPPYTDVADVYVQATFGGQHVVDDIPCGQPPCVIGEEPTVVEKNRSIYSSNELYPGKIYRVGSVSSFRGYNVLHVQLYPLQYKLASKLATCYSEMTVQVKLKAGGKMDTFRDLAKDREIAGNLVDNPSTLSTYDSVSGKMEPLNGGTTYEYLIITTVPLLDEFQVLADWKADWVDGARVETVSAGASAEEVKNIINDYYTYYDTSYVLLGGDVGALPFHTRQVMGTNIAEDYWFGNLVGDDDISYYEVYIGRAPVDNEAEAEHFVNKVISFEQMAKPTANLFHQSRVNYNNVPDSRELAWQCQPYVPAGYTHSELFEEDGRIEKADWIDFWRNDGIMCEHIGHGSSTSYYINYEVGGGHVTWYTTDCPSMDNTFWPVHTSVACHSGEFTHEDCLAEAYVKADNGAVACFMNDKYGWYMSYDATMFSGDFIEMQFHALYQEGQENIGAILAHSKYHFIDEATDPGNPYRAYWEWCWREINLIGDPETPVLTKRPSPPATPSTPSGPSSGYVYMSYTYTASTTDPEGDDVLYEFSWGDDTTTTVGPYPSGQTASASHQWTRPVTYQIKVRAKDIYGAWSGWSGTKSVTLDQNDANSGGDAGNTFATATSISTGVTRKGTLYETNPTDMQDWYKFYAASGKYIKAYVWPPAGVDFDLQLYDPNENLKGTSKKGPGEMEYIYYQSDVSGYWRIHVYIYDGEGQYSVEVSVYSGGGGGCPILYVYDGKEYAHEGLLDIHDPDGTDIITDHTLVSTPERVKGLYQLRLTEHPQTISDIDQVKLYAILEDKTLVELSLIWAWHSEDGNVWPQLLFSDDWKTKILGADHNNGTSQSIYLTFLAPRRNMKIIGFLFVIEGNNMYYKIPY